MDINQKNSIKFNMVMIINKFFYAGETIIGRWCGTSLLVRCFKHPIRRGRALYENEVQKCPQ
jgi:hypothetical protein